MTEITLYSSVAPSIGAFFITARDEVAYKVGTQINPSTPGGDEHVISPFNIQHYPANRYSKYSNLSGRSYYLELTPNSCKQVFKILKLVR